MMPVKPKSVEAVVETAAETTTDVAATQVRSFEKAVEGIKQGAEAATATMEKAQVKVKEGVTRAMKSAEDMVHFSQGNVEAFVKSSQILASGFQDMTKLLAANAQATLDETMSAFKALSGVKSVKEAYELQTAFTKSAMEKAMAESGKLTEHSMKLAEQVYAPLTARVNVAVETFTAK